MCSDSSVESAPPSLGMPLAALEDLRSICQWLNNAGRNAYTSLLGSVRGSVVYKSLISLKEHQRTSSGGSMQKSHITYSPMPVRNITKFVYKIVLYCTIMFGIHFRNLN